MKTKNLLKIIFALAIGFLGGLIFYILTMPLPWMLGSIVFCLIASIIKLPILPPKKIRPVFVIVIGVLLGSGFNQEIINQIFEISISLVFLFFHLLACILLIIPYYMYLGKFDFKTAFYASMPGGLNEMTIMSEESGADDRKVALAHVVRIFFVVIMVAFWFRVIEKIDIVQPLTGNLLIYQYSIKEFFFLITSGVLGFYIAKFLNLPAKNLLGPMILSGIFYSTNIIKSPPPQEIVVFAQIILGTAIGCRFIGINIKEIFKSMVLGLGATFIMISLTISFSFLFYDILNQKFLEIILAYAPGGIAEMGIIAYSMNADISFVGLHQVFRLAMIVFLAPLILFILKLRIKNF